MGTCACGRPKAGVLLIVNLDAAEVEMGGVAGAREVCGPGCLVKLLEAAAAELRLNLKMPAHLTEQLAEARREGEVAGRENELSAVLGYLGRKRSPEAFAIFGDLRRREHRDEEG